MNRILTIVGGFVLLLISLLLSQPVAAESLSLSPLEYKETLTEGDKKKGHIDLINPEPTSVNIHLRVRGFAQVNDTGGIDFFDDETLAEGVVLDLREIELGPKEGARIYFLLDSDKLPKGDVFAAILARTAVAGGQAGTSSAVEVGTLLMLTNGQSPEHTAAVDALRVPWWQFGNEIAAEVAVRNNDPPNGQAIGFSPQLSVEMWPYGSKTVEGPLLFAGRSRVISYSQPGNYIGPVRVTINVAGHSKATWTFVATGYWRLVLPVSVVTLALLICGIFYYRRHHDDRGITRRRRLF